MSGFWDACQTFVRQLVSLDRVSEDPQVSSPDDLIDTAYLERLGDYESMEVSLESCSSVSFDLNALPTTIPELTQIVLRLAEENEELRRDRAALLRRARKLGAAVFETALQE